MRLRSSLFLLCFAVLGGFGVWGWVRVGQQAQELHELKFARERADFLQTENNRLSIVLADKQRAEDLVADHRQRDSIEQTVASLSQLKFLRPVVFREIPRTELPAILSQS